MISRLCGERDSGRCPVRFFSSRFLLIHVASDRPHTHPLCSLISFPRFCCLFVLFPFPPSSAVDCCCVRAISAVTVSSRCDEQQKAKSSKSNSNSNSRRHNSNGWSRHETEGVPASILRPSPVAFHCASAPSVRIGLVVGGPTAPLCCTPPWALHSPSTGRRRPAHDKQTTTNKPTRNNTYIHTRWDTLNRYGTPDLNCSSVSVSE